MSDDIKREPEARAEETVENVRESQGAPESPHQPERAPEGAPQPGRAPGSGEAPRDRPRPSGGYGRDPRDSRDDSRSGPPRGGGRGRDGRPRFRSYYRRKVCKFCTKKTPITFRDTDALRRFITDRGKILPRRITGTCPKHQRALSKAIKQARVLALLPFVEK